MSPIAGGTILTIIVAFIYAVIAIASVFYILHLNGLLNKERKQKRTRLYDADLKTVSTEMLSDTFNYRINSEKRILQLAIFSVELEGLKELVFSQPPEIKKPLVREIINRIKTILSFNDLVSRTDNNDFILLVGENNIYSDTDTIASRLVTSLQQPYVIRGNEYNLTPYIGISTYPEQAQDIEVLLNNASAARINVKKQGIKHYSFSCQEQTISQEDILLMEMEKALTRKEFVLYYQPQYDIESNKVIGVEALIRWIHPKKGLLPPSDFIPLAESSGFIVPLGYWILEEACNQFKKWGDNNIIMSVNLSAYQFRQPNLLDNIKLIIDRTGIPPHNLNLEITESTTMKDIDFTIEVIKQLRTLGVLISIDDFGTGYSSLAYLRNFPITHLKIDRSFVVATDEGQNGEIVIKNIINLARELKLKVIAEGVETEGQYNLLKLLGCNEIQGYLLSPPKEATLVKDKYLQPNYRLDIKPNII